MINYKMKWKLYVGLQQQIESTNKSGLEGIAYLNAAINAFTDL